MLGNITKEEEKVLLQKLINELKNDPKINAWEKEFLASIAKQVAIGNLSEKQLSVLSRIKEKCNK